MFKWIGFRVFKWPGGRAKENLHGGSLKYLFVYFKIRLFKSSYSGWLAVRIWNQWIFLLRKKIQIYFFYDS